MKEIKKKTLKNLLARNEIEKVLSHLMDYYSNDKDLEDELIITSNRFYKNEKNYSLGLINLENHNVKNTNIIKFLISFLNHSYPTKKEKISIESTHEYYEKKFYTWLKTEFNRAKKIKFNYEIYPRILIDCYLETQFGYKYIFITNKKAIEKLEEFLNNLLKVADVNDILIVNFNNDKDVDFNYLQIDGLEGDIMDIHWLENLSLLDVEIDKRGRIKGLSDSIYQLSEEKDEDD